MAKTTKNKAKDVETPVKQKNPLLKDMTGEQLAATAHRNSSQHRQNQCRITTKRV